MGGREKGTSSQEVREREKAERECMGERERQTYRQRAREWEGDHRTLVEKGNH